MLEQIQQQLVAELTTTWGDHGYFHDGSGRSHVPQNAALTAFFATSGISQPLDWRGGRYANVIKRWIIETVPDQYGAHYMVRTIDGDYKHVSERLFGHSNRLTTANTLRLSSGWFSQGFAGLQPEDRGPLLWSWQQAAEEYAATYDTRAFGHRVLLALLHWPDQGSATVPQDLVLVDQQKGHVIVRDRYQDGNDSMVQILMGSEPDAAGRPHIRWEPIRVWFRGNNITFPGLFLRQKLTKTQSFGTNQHSFLCQLTERTNQCR